MRQRLIWILPITAFFACVSARMSEQDVDRLFRDGEYERSAELLEKGLAKQGENSRDELLYLLDWGLSLHSAQKHRDAIKVFLRADEIADLKDYTSLSAEIATVITTDNLKHYKGEDFENVLINTFAALDYAALGEFEDAIVEAKRVNRKLYMMINDGQRKYKQNAFAYYLSGALYEARKNYNDAYIDYKKVLELAPEHPGLGQDLWRMAFLLHRKEDQRKWTKQFGLKESPPNLELAEAIIVFENGISPVKRPHPNLHSIPKFYARTNPVSGAQVFVDEKEQANTAMLFDIESTAIENLDEKYAGLIAKKLAGVVVKEVVGNQVEQQTDSPLLGILTKMFLYAADQADLRSWNLLPRDLQIARVTLEPGQHKIQLKTKGLIVELPTRELEFQKGEKKFLSFRYTPRE